MGNKNQPIHPASVVENNGNVITVNGLTKREYFAGLAMQGLLAANVTLNPKDCAEDSVKYTDALLKQLETT